MLIVTALLISSVVGVQTGIQLVNGINRNRFSRLFSVVIAVAIFLIIIDLMQIIREL